MTNPQQTRMTRQRRVILEQVRKMKAHLTADEVYDAVKEHLPRISLGTVYRNLEILCELGMIQKLELSGTLKRFDWDVRKHYHIRCINCDRIDNAQMGFMADVETALNGATPYHVIGHRLEFLGLCPSCMEKALDRESLNQTVGAAESSVDSESNFG